MQNHDEDKIDDSAMDGPPEPSLVDVAIGVVVSHRNWSECSDTNEALAVWGESAEEVEAALRARGYGEKLDRAILALDKENHAHGQCVSGCKDPSHIADNLHIAWCDTKIRIHDLRAMKASAERDGFSWGGSDAQDLERLETSERICTEDEFWAFIEPFGWGTATTDSQAIKVALLHQLTPIKAGALRDQLDVLTGALHQRLEAERVRLECGDDSYQDLLAHVVGLGRAEYEKALADPRLLEERCDKRQYTESFSYALPYPNDFEYLTLAHYQSRATELRSVYEVLRDDEAFQKILSPTQVVLAALALVAEGKVDDALRCEKTTRDAADAISTFYRQQGQRFGVFVDGSRAGNPHGVHNLFIDLRRYFVPFQEKSS